MEICLLYQNIGPYSFSIMKNSTHYIVVRLLINLELENEPKSLELGKFELNENGLIEAFKKYSEVT